MPEEKRQREESEREEALRNNLSGFHIHNPLMDEINKTYGDMDKRTKEVHQVWNGGSDSFPDKNSDFFWRDETPANNIIAFFVGESIEID